MKREHVISLTRRVSAVSGVAVPIIVGSQALYAATGRVPGLVERSVECDYLLADAGGAALTAVREELGIMSEFQKTWGYYADALGLATVVLPPGWRQRLVGLQDDAGSTIALCTEVHDTCVAKLMAGREKDWPLILDVLSTGVASMETFMDRAALVVQLPQSPALLERLTRFEGILWTRRPDLDRGPVRRLIRTLKEQTPGGRGGQGYGG